jgi:hypothetical protein
VERRASPAQLGLIGHIVMDQEEGVQELEPRSEPPQPRGHLHGVNLTAQESQP